MTRINWAAVWIWGYQMSCSNELMIEIQSKQKIHWYLHNYLCLAGWYSNVQCEQGKVGVRGRKLCVGVAAQHYDHNMW